MTRANVTSATTTQLVAKVPRGASGKVTVRTPGGEVVHTQDFFSPPGAPTDLSSTGRITIGTSANVGVTTANKIGMRVFAGTRGQRISITGTTPNSTKVYVLRHDGVPFRAVSDIAPANGSYFYDTVTLPVDADYAVVVDPESTNTGTTSVLVRNVPADPTTTMTVGGSAVTLTTTVPGQNASATFSGTAGQKFSMYLSNLTMGWSDLAILDPNGFYLVLPTLVQGNKFFDTLTLPTTGTYRVTVSSQAGGVGSVTLQAYDVPADASGTMAIGGSPLTLTTTVPGQNAYATFSGTANQNVSMQLSGLTMGQADVTIKNPDDSVLVPSTFVVGDKFFDTVTLPTTGTYKVVVNPRDQGTGSVTLRLYEVPADASGTMTIGGSPLTLTTTIPGQNAFATFEGSANQLIRLVCSAVTIGNSDVSILKPDGSTLVAPTFVNTFGKTIDTQLTVAGTYKIVVNPRDNNTGSMTLALTERTSLAPDSILVASHDSPGLAAVAPVRRVVPDALARPPLPTEPVAAPPTADDPGSEEWIPGPRNLKGDWRSGRKPSRWQELEPLSAKAGVTALSGQALRLNGLPLRGVTVSIGPVSEVTDRNGQFLLEDIPAGRQELAIDGRTANQANRTYGFFEAGVNVRGGETNVLPYTIWMPKLDMKHTVRISSPTTEEVVLTTPYIPGLEVRIPAGAVVTDADGEPVTEIGITPIPVDRAPFALPTDVYVPVYFTVQPGGGYIVHADGRRDRRFGARIIYPNYGGHPPGSRIQFYRYDPHVRDWYVYGLGTVTENGRRVVPDPGLVVYHLTGAMIDGIGPPNTWPIIGGLFDGDPADVGTGLFVLRKPDLALHDVIPIVLTRTYRPGDSTVRAFGRGAAHPYAIYLWSAQQYEQADLILPDGGRVHYVRISPGAGYVDAVFEHTSTPGRFYGSRISWNGKGWDLRLRDGTVLVLGDNAPLQAIRDRYGNETSIGHSNGQAGNVTFVRSPNGRWIEFTYDGSNRVETATDNTGRTVLYTYWPTGELHTVTDPNGGVTEYTYDGSGRMWKIKDARGITYLTNEYDANGRIWRQTQADGTTYQFAYVLDGNGKVTQTDVTDPRGKVRRLTFNGAGYVLTDTRAYGTALAQTLTYVRLSGSNLVDTITDARNRLTDLDHDASGNLTSVTRLAGTPDAVTTTIDYEPVFNQIDFITDPLTHTTDFDYDTAGRLTTVTNAIEKSWTFGYNAAGQVTSATTPAPRSDTTTFTYKSGDLVTVIDPLGNAANAFVDPAGRVTIVRDALGLNTRYVYDVLNRPTSITDPRGGATSFGYDPNGNLRTLTDARGKVTTWDYDDMDQVISRTDPLTRVETYDDYDGLGNLIRYTDRKGQVTTFGYDDLGRREFAGFGTSGSPPNETYASTIDYDYDTGNRLWRAIDSADGTITLGYDELDRLTSETNPRGGLTYTYDDAGRRETMTVAGQPTVSYTFDDADRLTLISQGSSTVGLTYDEAGRRSRLTLPNGISVDYGYDDASRLTALTYKLGQTTLGDLAYAYDPAGQRTRVSGSYARSNIPASLSSALYDDANRLSNWAGTTISYDYNGNLSNDGTKIYTWNERNKLASMTGTPAASFSYDAFGRRIRKTISGSSTDFLYDGLNAVQELSGGPPTADLITGGLDEVFLRTDSTGGRSFLADGLGSTLALADPAGTLQTSYTYEPFGKPSSSGQTNANSFQFTGRETDGTGLLFYRARYYQPNFSRFVSEDPIGFAGGDANLHAYVFNSPTNYVDPLGLYAGGVSPEDVARSIVNAPWTALGLTGALLTGSDGCELYPGLIIECYENDWLPAGDAITIGSSVTTGLTKTQYETDDPLVRPHENRHVRQWAEFGPLFPAAYAGGATYSQMTTGDLFCGNPFEIEAGPTAAYVARCGWQP